MREAHRWEVRDVVDNVAKPVADPISARSGADRTETVATIDRDGDFIVTGQAGKASEGVRSRRSDGCLSEQN